MPEVFHQSGKKFPKAGVEVEPTGPRGVKTQKTNIDTALKNAIQ
jgi:hypothetical protein